MVIRPQGAMGPVVVEIILLIEQIHFKHKILGNMMGESSTQGLAVFWEVFPLLMQGKSSIGSIIVAGGDKCNEVREGCGSG